jgi:antirestriction protein ArdC
VLREDNRAIIRVPSQASKAANDILGFLPGGPAQAAGAVVSFALPWNQGRTMRLAGSFGGI